MDNYLLAIVAYLHHFYFVHYLLESLYPNYHSDIGVIERAKALNCVENVD